MTGSPCFDAGRRRHLHSLLNHPAATRARPTQVTSQQRYLGPQQAWRA